MTSMHALPLLAAFVDPYDIFFRQAVIPPRSVIRFGDEPNPEARLFRAEARRASLKLRRLR
jgi:hypothetical protein